MIVDNKLNVQSNIYWKLFIFDLLEIICVSNKNGISLMGHRVLLISAQIDIMQYFRNGSGKLNSVYMWLVLINICRKDFITHQIIIIPTMIPPSFILVPRTVCMYRALLFSINDCLKDHPNMFYMLTSERTRHKYNIFSHQLKPFWAMDGKWVLILLSFIIVELTLPLWSFARSFVGNDAWVTGCFSSWSRHGVHCRPMSSISIFPN